MQSLKQTILWVLKDYFSDNLGYLFKTTSFFLLALHYVVDLHIIGIKIINIVYHEKNQKLFYSRSGCCLSIKL